MLVVSLLRNKISVRLDVITLKTVAKQNDAYLKLMNYMYKGLFQ